MGQVEVTGIVNAERPELFAYTDWCYNVPQWFAAIRETRIVRLPDAAGEGKVTHYVGTLLGRDMEWEARTAEWKENERWAMKAAQGTPAKMNMRVELRFETAEHGRTKVTCSLRYHAPYPLLGALIDRFYLRKEGLRLANLALDGIRRVAEQHQVPSIGAQLEKRRTDHPGYQTGPGATMTPALA